MQPKTVLNPRDKHVLLQQAFTNSEQNPDTSPGLEVNDYRVALLALQDAMQGDRANLTEALYNHTLSLNHFPESNTLLEEVRRVLRMMGGTINKLERAIELLPEDDKEYMRNLREDV